MALLHQCSEAAHAIKRRVEEIQELEHFAADAHAACFRAGAGDLQFGLLRAGFAPVDLQFPSVHRETQEMGCQANPCALSTSTQDGPGISFIKRNLKDCPLQASSTKYMDEYLGKYGYGPVDEEDRSSHSFRCGPRYVDAVGSRFRSVSPISLQTTPDSKIQEFRDQDREMHSERPFRGVHVLAYMDDMYPVVLPTRSRRTIITEQLSRTMLELEKPLPAKDSLLSWNDYVKAQQAAVDPAACGSGQSSIEAVQAAVEPAEAVWGTCPLGAVRRGQETDSRTEVEAAHQEPAPSSGAFRPFWTALPVGVPQAVTKPPPGGFLTKAQRKTPLLFAVDNAEDNPQSATESFDLGGGDFQPPEEPEEQDDQQLQMATSTVPSDAPLNTEGATKVTATTAPATVSRLPVPQTTEGGRVLPPCTVSSFPAPHPDWAIKVTEKDLSSLLPDDLPSVKGVKGNRSTALLKLDFDKFVPSEDLSDSEIHLCTADNIQKALRKALVHPEVEKSLLPPPTADRHPGLVTIEDLRCLSEKDQKALKALKIQFFPILQDHITGGPSGHSHKVQQYLLAGLVFGWYPAHFRQKKLDKVLIEDLGCLAQRIKRFDGGLSTFQSCNTLVMCPFPDCLYMCSSQYHAVKHAMLEHYRTMMVCGSCLCYVAPTLAASITVGSSLMSFKDHILVCGGMAGPSTGGPSTGKGPSTSGASAENADLAQDDATSAKDSTASAKGDANGAGGIVEASGAGRPNRKRQFKAIFGRGSDNSDSSDTEDGATKSTRKRNMNAIIGGDSDDSEESRPRKRTKWGHK